ncbi:restriction endonuclease subunit S [Paludibacterium paludis]|uniref:Type I restriction enzyme S subunit n=1 Tax=Paludibacterium paludis TaxID=1225769 RepID=A0A918P683_9NEIS|nr:restriction endonuclease subunit S [Paludibacterium paludis]GGY30151.1 hypothetical protein GCM10011289_36170 [Paludibacterium paludis]
MRVDSSYFMKEFLSLSRFPNSIGDIALVRSGTTPTDRDDDLKDGVVLLKTIDVQNRPLNTADSDSFYRISPEIAKRMEKTSLESKDVLINIVGATTDVIGRVALVPRDFPEANITQAMALIRTAGSLCVPEVLFCFLAGKFGQSQVRRLARPTGQYNLNLPEVESITIPTFSANFSDRVRLCVEAATGMRGQSRQLLQQAEQTLLHDLSLDTWTPPEALSYERSSSDAFAAGRFDAEHYQPRFAALLALIESTGNSARLGDCLLENKRGKQPDYATTGLPVVNSKHVLRNDVRLDADNRLATFATNDLLIAFGDVLVNGTGVGTIGRTATYLHECQAVPDNHVTILRPKKDLDPIYLSIFMNSIAGQLQVDQRLRGSSGQIELYPNDIAEFRVWVAPKELQQSIRDQVEQSFVQKQRAAQLLDAAKRAVEIAIEDSEAAALTYLKGLM